MTPHIFELWDNAPNDTWCKHCNTTLDEIPGMHGNLAIPAAVWLSELFESEYCAECHGDIEDHDAIPFLGNWFARCKDNAQCRIEDCEHD